MESISSLEPLKPLIMIIRGDVNKEVVVLGDTYNKVEDPPPSPLLVVL